MRCFSFIALFLFAAAEAAAQTSVGLDRIETIKLDEEGRARIRVNAPRTGMLRPDIFSAPDETGAIHFTVESKKQPDEATENSPIPASGLVVEKGRHILAVQSEGAQKAEIQLRLLLEPALDLYEPNDNLDDAKPLETPFLGFVRLSDSDEDWFRVNAPRGEVIGVHLRSSGGYEGPVVSFHERNGDVLYESPRTNWGHRGMRYYKSEGQPIYVKVTDSYNWSEDDSRAFRLLEIETFIPDPNSANAFVKIDMGGEERASRQIDFVGEAAGTRVASAEEAIEIAKELDLAVRDKTSSGFQLALWLGVAFVAVASAAVYFRLRKKRVNTRTPSDSTDVRP